ncbi:MAG TPA: DMT family transporter [Syntrophorhabdaceae bacterium]|nr:DMT family transporter [Syntrophorhabdaceae bacterium]HQM80639.1 DMT family transporter [Syntrophorhabdaceae bacterium]
MAKDHLDLQGFLILLVLTMLWGLNYTAIKIANTGFAPVFNAFLRSSIASAFGVAYCLSIKQPLFHRDIRFFHGCMVGLLFGLEFVCLYIGLLYTDSARAGILINFSPFVVAIGAYLFLKEKLGITKIAGLVLAFTGLYSVFQGKPMTWNTSMLFGDILELGAAVMWGATTVYIKKFLADRVHPIHTFLYQLVLSIPVLFICAFFLEQKWVLDVSSSAVLALLYSSIVIAFASYFVWFKLIHTYPVSELAVFTFLTPVFGVVCGAIFLGEQVTTGLIIGLLLVSGGIYLTNYRKKN